MKTGIRIGRVLGVDIAVDRSWIVIFLLVAWNLSALFDRQHPSWGLAANVVLAVVTALLFFLSIVAHELAHTLVAEGFHIPVRSITLFLFGGVSNIESEPPTAGAEFWMALVGPVTSIVIGVALTAGWLFAAHVTAIPDLRAAPSTIGAVGTVLMWLGPVNVAIGLFNLIPGFPLDGGRILRSLLWALTRDLARATRWAAYAGQVIGWAFVVAGVASIFGARVPFVEGGIAGAWIAFIGWFLASAAHASYRRVVVHASIAGIPVWRVMRTSGPMISAERSLGEAVHDVFMHSDDSCIPVMSGDRFVGLLELTDTNRYSKDQWETTPVRAAMTPLERLTSTTPHEDVTAVLKRLGPNATHPVPVLNQGRLVGLLDERDVGRWVDLHSGPTSGGRRPAFRH